ncbi:MAG: alpha-L-arabinofuranosidase [Citrobacter freundii]|nr:MAG: alpha-L-arabinofuranosidase [Citrobacter freundii]
MIDPVLFQTTDGMWHCVWTLNEEVNQFAHASSTDLVNWGRQSYPYLQPVTAFLHPAVVYDRQTKDYRIMFDGSDSRQYMISTNDFKIYTSPKLISAVERSSKKSIVLNDREVSGTAHRVSWKTVEQLLGEYQSRQYQGTLGAEDARKDSIRFAGMKPPLVSLKVQPSSAKPISSMLTGVFFEDINYSADGGLYAELIQNRDFEYALTDKEGRDKNWNNSTAWSATGELSFLIDSVSPAHTNNPHYAVLKTTGKGALINTGFDGIAVKKGESYRFNVLLKRLDKTSGALTVRLVTAGGETIAQTSVKNISHNWKKYPATLVAAATVADCRLELEPQSASSLAVDMVSLFPAKTFKGRANGLRPDLAQAIADIRPKFVRFPGGCVAHGDGLGNIYRWKNTIGPLEARVPQRNLWGYHQTAGLGYFEYFQYCEDIGAEPVPVVAAGVPCQNSGVGGGGQQGGIPMAQMDEYVQDVLDLIEYANGDSKTKWGKIRAETGHPAPFNLKYIGIGNEDLITDVFEERYLMICRAVKAKYPAITVIGTVGPFFEGTDYREGWAIATREKIDMVDEHYYQTPGWFINNQDFYDSYDRSKSKVYLGEYASRGTALYNALAEAAYLTALERNGDIVTMASYAPLLAKENHTQWNPDLVYFNNTEVKPTIGYEVQKLYGNNSGDIYLPATITNNAKEEAARKRVAASVVKDTKTGDLIIKLVNLLPVETSLSIDLAGLNIFSQQAKIIRLKGKPGDKKAEIENTTVNIEATFSDSLPPYSFSVLRIKTK